METEELDVLMEDAGVIIDYSVNHKSKLPIAMCVLYAACAADRNENISQAYCYLSDADKQYEGNDLMVNSERDASENPEISDGSSDTGVSGGSDVSDELEELEDVDIEKAAIKAEWYFKNWLKSARA